MMGTAHSRIDRYPAMPTLTCPQDPQTWYRPGRPRPGSERCASA